LALQNGGVIEGKKWRGGWGRRSVLFGFAGKQEHAWARGGGGGEREPRGEGKGNSSLHTRSAFILLTGVKGRGLPNIGKERGAG